MNEKEKKSCFDGKKLKAFREEKSLTQKDIEYKTEELGSRINERTIRGLEKGGRKPNLSTLRILAEVLEKKPNDFYCGEDETESLLSKYRIDFADFIEDRTRNFVGRNFIFEEISDFIAHNNNGYIIFKGDPGIGKSSIMAKLVKDKQYIHHFNIASEGINKASCFLKNVCAQIINYYQLDYTSISPEAWDDGKFLYKLLREASKKINQRLFIIVDSLDEVDISGQSMGANILYLPPRLPDNVFIIMSARNQDISLRLECAYKSYPIEHNSKENRADITEYLKHKVGLEGIKNYVNKHKIKTQMFIDSMLEKSEGNFMYLRYVLPEIEKGIYQNLNFKELPTGLENYYQDHWRRMNVMDNSFREKIKIIYVLSESHQPISASLLKDFASADSITIQSVLDGWGAFLHKQKINGCCRYSIYHSSFKDFLNRKEVIREARVNIKNINDSIGDSFFNNQR